MGLHMLEQAPQKGISAVCLVLMPSNVVRAVIIIPHIFVSICLLTVLIGLVHDLYQVSLSYLFFGVRLEQLYVIVLIR